MPTDATDALRAWCEPCESLTLKPVTFMVINDDGSYGSVPGVMCSQCREGGCDDDPAAFVPTGWIDLGGLSPHAWLVARLRALGCNPHPRPPRP
jgi:hypothetical protein